jgi:hypothetical protein
MTSGGAARKLLPTENTTPTSLQLLVENSRSCPARNDWISVARSWGG